eukprot:Opistho-1_new@12426
MRDTGGQATRHTVHSERPDRATAGARKARSVDLDRAVDLAEEEEARVEANGAREEPERERNEERVAKVHHRRDGIRDAELGAVVEDGVKVHVEGAPAAHEERPPPPVVVLVAEVEVDEDDRVLRARDDENDEHEEEEPKQVVKLVLPKRRKDEEQLNEDGAKRKDAGKQHARDRRHVPRLVRDLARNLVGAHGLLVRRLAVPKVRSEEDEGQRDAEPHEEKHNHRGERHGERRVLAPHEKVEEEGNRKHRRREQHRRHHRLTLPVLPLARLVEARREIPRKDTHEDKEDEGHGEQTAAAGGREHAEKSEHERDDEHAEQLDARAHTRREGRRVVRRAEDVAVDKLPASLIRRIVLELLVVVAGDVPPHGAHENEGDNAREEENDHERVDDGKPVDLIVVHREVDVPHVLCVD